MRSLRWLTVALLLLATLPVPAAAAENTAVKPLLIDVRTEAEWQSEHLEGAILIPYERIGAEIARVAPDKKTKINLYCRTGRRSGIAQETLQKLGYEDVTNDGSVKDAAEKLTIPVIRSVK
jgi:phage shock protein E